MESPSISGAWYAAVLVIRSRVGGTTDGAPILDHQVRLLRASDAENAYERALELGAEEAHSYLNLDGETVTWEFAGLHDLAELVDDDLADGVEVYSWRTRGRIDDAVLPKERLTVFWAAANAHRTARELLDRPSRPRCIISVRHHHSPANAHRSDSLPALPTLLDGSGSEAMLFRHRSNQIHARFAVGRDAPASLGLRDPPCSSARSPAGWRSAGSPASSGRAPRRDSPGTSRRPERRRRDQ